LIVSFDTSVNRWHTSSMKFAPDTFGFFGFYWLDAASGAL